MADILKLRKNLEKKGYTTSYFESGAEAVDYLKEQIHGTTVAFGGSRTLEQLGLYDALKAHNKVIWHWKGDSREEARTARIYICSANGVSEGGELVNIDGTGNRLSSTLYGPEKVYFVIGINKIEPDLERAIWRARNIAAPITARRLKLNTPCAKSEELRCFDCSSPQRICRAILIHLRHAKGCIYEVVIINEELGS